MVFWWCVGQIGIPYLEAMSKPNCCTRPLAGVQRQGSGLITRYLQYQIVKWFLLAIDYYSYQVLRIYDHLEC